MRQAAERDEAGWQAARRILEAADGRRRRLARDLHDGAQQQFVSVVVNVQLARAKLPPDSQRAMGYLDAALRQCECGIAELRELASGVHPAVLTHLGLSAAIDALANGFAIPVEVDVTPRPLPSQMQESIYFFIAEAMTNVAKHAHAGTVAIQVAASSTLVAMEVSDDGIGGARLGHRGSGLIGLIDRMEAFDGDFALTSPPQGGTTVRGMIPLRTGWEQAG